MRKKAVVSLLPNLKISFWLFLVIKKQPPKRMTVVRLSGQAQCYIMPPKAPLAKLNNKTQMLGDEFHETVIPPAVRFFKFAQVDLLADDFLCIHKQPIIDSDG